MNSKGLHLRRGVLFDGVRVDLGNNNCIDIKSGMKPAGEFGRFVMGVFAPTAENDPFFDTASPGVYPIYGNISSLKAEIRFGPNLFGLSKQDRSAMIKTKWEWMDDNSVRRRCNVDRIAFQKKGAPRNCAEATAGGQKRAQYVEYGPCEWGGASGSC